MASKPVRSQFPMGKIGDRKYQLALKNYNASKGTSKPAAKPASGSRPGTNPTAAQVRGAANKNNSKPATKPAASEKPKKGDYVSPFADARDTYFKQAGRYQVPKDKPSKPDPEPSKPPKPKPQPSGTRPADKVPSSGSKTSSSNVGPVASGDEYARNKDPKKYNPLMQKTFGYQKGDAPDQRAKRERIAEAESQANKARVKQGPAAPTSPAKPATPNDPKKSGGQKSKNLMEEIRKRRLNR